MIKKEPSFIHLDVFSEYSLGQSIIRIKSALDKCFEDHMPALGIVEHNNLFSAFKFYKKAVHLGIKPIIGANISVQTDHPNLVCNMTFLCKNSTGYNNLSHLITRSYIEGYWNDQASINIDWLNEKNSTGLIAISGGESGLVQSLLLTGKTNDAADQLKKLQAIFFNDVYLSIQRLGNNRDEELLYKTLECSFLSNTPLLAANNPRFLDKGDYLALDARVCIEQHDVIDNAKRIKDYTNEQYFKTQEEMSNLFSDIPEALTNTVNIAKKCNFKFKTDQVALPTFLPPKGLSVEEYLKREAKQGLDQLVNTDEKLKKIYFERLNSELDIIISTGFSGYFLIVSDFVKWSRAKNIPVGPGRGSGPGSLVAFCLGITDIDPIQYDLLFERFLNPERISMPDFDIDFCVKGRDQVIDYVSNQYGLEMVSQIITFGTMSAKAVVRDVGRILGYPFGMVDQIAKLIPFEIGITIENALKKESELNERYENDQEVQAIINLALQLEGLVRNAGKHAGGVVIAPSNLSDFMPLYTVEGDEGGTVTQFDKDDVESMGLIKFDFLGLKTLTVIQTAVELINQQQSDYKTKAIDIRKIPTDDIHTYQLLSSAKTVGVFQLESTGMRDLIKRMQPDKFDDIIALVALFRPGPLLSGMVDDFIERRKAGQSKLIDFLHPMLESILRTTYGVIVYQEQVMQIAQKLAKYTQGSADILRKAMGKKIPEEMIKQKDIFIQGAIDNDVKESTAIRIFDLIEKFAGYGFNKSHSVSYAFIAYQTAWLKAHYPAQFMAASMTADMNNTDKIIPLKEDCSDLNIKILQPCINHSGYGFIVQDSESIRYGLGAIKGIGESAAEAITDERLKEGDYKDFFDFCSRLSDQKLSKRTIEALIKSGAADCFNENRSTLFRSVETGVNFANKKAMDRKSGQNNLFSIDGAQAETPPSLNRGKEWKLNDFLQGEFQSLGFYFSGHPFDPYRKDCIHLTRGPLIQIKAMMETSNGSQRFDNQYSMDIAGLALDVKRRGNNLVFRLDDGTAIIDAIVFGENKDRFRDLINNNAVLHLNGSFRYDTYADTWQFVASEILELNALIEKRAKTLLIKCDSGFDPEKLKSILQAHTPGSCEVNVHYKTDIDVYKLQFGQEWTVKVTKELRDRLTVEFGSGNFQFLTHH